MIHYALDCYGCSRNLDNLETVYALLEEIPKLLKFGKTITPPYVFPFGEETSKGKGAGGMVLLAEIRGHISVQTFLIKGVVCLDVFSERPFRDQQIIELVSRYFGIQSHDDQIIIRGIPSKV